MINFITVKNFFSNLYRHRQKIVFGRRIPTPWLPSHASALRDNPFFNAKTVVDYVYNACELFLKLEIWKTNVKCNLMIWERPPPPWENLVEIWNDNCRLMVNLNLNSVQLITRPLWCVNQLVLLLTSLFCFEWLFLTMLFLNFQSLWCSNNKINWL